MFIASDINFQGVDSRDIGAIMLKTQAMNRLQTDPVLSELFNKTKLYLETMKRIHESQVSDADGKTPSLTSLNLKDTTAVLINNLKVPKERQIGNIINTSALRGAKQTDICSLFNLLDSIIMGLKKVSKLGIPNKMKKGLRASINKLRKQIYNMLSAISTAPGLKTKAESIAKRWGLRVIVPTPGQ